MAVINEVGYYPCLLKKEVPGFVENRVLYAIMRECLALVDEGVVDLEELDLNVKWGIGYKLAVIPPDAPAGHGRAWTSTPRSPATSTRDLSNASEVSPTITDLIEKGRLGHEDQGRPLRLHATRRSPRSAPQRAMKLVAVRKAIS